MSIAYQCDRCGKLVAIPSIKFHIPIVKVNERDIFGSESRELEKVRTLDLCDECSDSLTEWLSMMNDIMAEGDNNHGRNICAGASEKGARNPRRKARKADVGDTQDEG